MMAVTLGACMHGGTNAMVARPDGFGVFYNDQGEQASLAYGQANSDNVALMMQCKKGAGAIQVSDTVRAKPAPSLVLASGGRTSELLSRVEPGETGAPPMVVADTTAQADALKAFRRSGKMNVAYGDTRYGVSASREEMAGVELFFSVCGKQAA
ncbi:MAG: hypothetical protein ACXW3D_08260 [Caulobacteraceae bacterium]